VRFFIRFRKKRKTRNIKRKKARQRDRVTGNRRKGRQLEILDRREIKRDRQKENYGKKEWDRNRHNKKGTKEEE
jgi:hypothetical protein